MGTCHASLWDFRLTSTGTGTCCVADPRNSPVVLGRPARQEVRCATLRQKNCENADLREDDAAGKPAAATPLLPVQK
eukprot:1149738-Pelagomonas_calceolata.AAC.6